MTGNGSNAADGEDSNYISGWTSSDSDVPGEEGVGGDSWTFEQEAMARGLLSPIKMYMISIGQEEPIQVNSIREALSSRTFIRDLGRFVYKVKPGQIFEHEGNNYVKIKNSDKLRDRDTKCQIVDGKLQTQIEDLIPVEIRQELFADAQANADDANSVSQFVPRLRF